MYDAYLFDLNGTLVDDMEYHGRAWYEMLTVRLGAGLTPEDVKRQMYGRNDELLKRVFGENRFTDEELHAFSLEKEVLYQQMYRPYMTLLPGLASLLDRLHQKGKPMAIGSAALPLNIDFVLDTLDIRRYFRAVVSAADVTRSKPDPETYLMAAEKLGVEPRRCLVFEDAPKGVECARNAGMDCIVLTTTHPPTDFETYPNTIGFFSDYTDHSIFTACLK